MERESSLSNHDQWQKRHSSWGNKINLNKTTTNWIRVRQWSSLHFPPCFPSFLAPALLPPPHQRCRGQENGVVVSSSLFHFISATPSSLGGKLLTILPCCNTVSLPLETVLYEFIPPVWDLFGLSPPSNGLLQCRLPCLLWRQSPAWAWGGRRWDSAPLLIFMSCKGSVCHFATATPMSLPHWPGCLYACLYHIPLFSNINELPKIKRTYLTGYSFLKRIIVEVLFAQAWLELGLWS